MPAGTVSPQDASGFVSLADTLPDILLEIRYFSTYNFIGERIDGYTAPRALMTREAAQALSRVSRWAKDLSDVRMKPYFYPQVNKANLFKEGYIAAKSGHSRGSTVDLTLFDMAHGREVDMGGPFDYFGDLSHPDYTQELSPEQLANRRLLRELMLSENFRPLSSEWWHFTLNQEPYPDTYFTFPV